MAASPTAQIEAFEPMMARVPEGWFWMGCEIGRDDEKPVHRFWVDAFELAGYQLTNEECARFLAAMRYPQPPCWNDTNFNQPKLPVLAKSWHESVTYCEWLSRATGKPDRLPSEAEWERAARGGAEHLLFSWGDAPPEQVPNYAARWKNGPGPVGVYPPNAYGLYNLGDNVHEWCADWYNAGYYSCSPERNPRGPHLRQPSSLARRHQVKSPALWHAQVFRQSSNTPTISRFATNQSRQNLRNQLNWGMEGDRILQRSDRRFARTASDTEHRLCSDLRGT